MIIIILLLYVMDLQMESEGNATENNAHGASAGLDHILKQLDLMSEFMDHLEGKLWSKFF